MEAKVKVLVEQTIEIPDLNPESVREFTSTNPKKVVQAEFFCITSRDGVDGAELRLYVVDHKKLAKGKPYKEYPFGSSRVYFWLVDASDIDVFADWVDHQRKLYPGLLIEDNRDDIQYD